MASIAREEVTDEVLMMRFQAGDKPAFAALVSLWFFVSAAYAGRVAVHAIRSGAFAPELGLDVHGRAATALGWATLVIAAAFLAAGVLVAIVGARA